MGAPRGKRTDYMLKSKLGNFVKMIRVAQDCAIQLYGADRYASLSIVHTAIITIWAEKQLQGEEWPSLYDLRIALELADRRAINIDYKDCSATSVDLGFRL